MTGPSSRRPRLPAIDARRCTGCGRCVAACAELHLLSLEARGWSKLAVLDNAHVCTGCALCAVACPFDAIHMVRRLTHAGPLE